VGPWSLRRGRALIKRGTVIFDEMAPGLKDIELLSDPTVGEVRIGATDPMVERRRAVQSCDEPSAGRDGADLRAPNASRRDLRIDHAIKSGLGE
jgi:hypothetical protein